MNEIECTELVIIGKEIVKKCGGAPLAAKALGSLLRFKREVKEWRYVKESKLWSLTQYENSVMPALRLSYLNLPMQLRQCFAFCALFPKDTKIHKHFLIDLWLANGFISSNEILEAEDIGDEVLNELYWRSFFQDIETDKFGKITNFKMHDLVHDLAQSVAEEICHTEDGVISVPERIRHLSIHKKADSIQLRQFKSLRTFLFPSHDQLSPDVFRCYSLQVLRNVGLNNLSSSISNLKHLRYLNLSYGKFKTLPESLCKLLNLQILKLDYCWDLQKLPNRLKCLKALRHICLEDCESLSSMTPEIGELISLRTLSLYVVGKQRGFLLAELGRLNLKGELHIKHLERVKCVMDAKDANMESKHLTKLVMSWDEEEESQEHENAKLILEVLQPHLQQLQSLEVKRYIGVQFPEWMGNPALLELNDVRLEDCESCFDLPPMGKLLSLKSMWIENMKVVEYVDNETYNGKAAGGCIALEYLVLKKFPNLIRLSREVGNSMFRRLSKLEITDCPKLALPCLPSLKQLRIYNKCNHILLSSIHKSRSLEDLELTYNKELSCFPDGMLRDLTSLKSLMIVKYYTLEVLPPEIANLSAIQQLRVWYCDNMEPLAEQVAQGLHSLKILQVRRCRKFNFSTAFQYLMSLESLEISELEEMEGLPKALQRITSLQDLTLANLPNLRSLPEWLGNLGLLHSLYIYHCPKLMCLPTTIQCLNALKTLTIRGCPELRKRCEKEIGEDWPKIAHIPNIHVS